MRLRNPVRTKYSSVLAHICVYVHGLVLVFTPIHIATLEQMFTMSHLHYISISLFKGSALRVHRTMK